MAGAMLSNYSRCVPRALFRIVSSPTTNARAARSLHQRRGKGRVLAAISGEQQFPEGTKAAVCTKNNFNQHWKTHVRHIRSTSSLWELKDVTVPPFAESVSEGDVRWDKKAGDQVKEDDVLCEIETDKTSVPVPTPVSGVIKEIFAKDGDTVKAGQKLCSIDVGASGGAAPAAAKADAPKPTPPPPPPPSPAAAAPKPAAPTPQPTQVTPPPPPPKPTTPPASRPPTPQAPTASMPVAAIKHAQSLEGARVQLPPEDYSREIIGTRTEQRVKMNRMRLRIAERLKDAQNTNAMLTTFNEIDMSQIMEFRKANQEMFMKKYGLKLGFMSAFIAASSYALKDQPVVNAVIDGNEIVYRDFVDISVAVATPKGLVVPVLRSVENKNFAEIEIALAALGDKAKKGKISVEDMDGGTFTISNGGVFGSLMGTPIINPPQSAILGMHGVFDRPIAVKGQVVIRPMMYIALTYDHRLIDGREAVMFLRKIKNAVEDPRVILAGL
ncbi:dihydrolipoyllysine-residue succinyltransferase component of 2-oxoglutarate dehydrogenase complex, mitochondrial [Neodiprion pinetum]|uniref:dihydrolipoyllysine-residue succinyltransferase component of 2-oxoglutarate dehydrogenase complex, mitochondrial n=1 Tax=Neodiprion fabricii TaxID=2872261 RepID=UPI00076FBBAC|nr:dihydrolipoyllysine-residue succinyltransferase component of 2-oxoglutarate dehydrogenase complex, mitochondrial [Neodiprion fabricii]XP_046490173.1 dihydrolipoyllysine-residue succinyltransferase component of 2-oxoglutarate dehydrogenase complex, mitochondrial [Neodiprion pinetum]